MSTQPHDPDRSLHRARAASFEHGADVYAATRPGYPPAVVDWMLDGVHATGSALRVLDLAAGTGKLTEALVERGLDVTAVDPSPAMLGRLVERLDGVRTAVGTAEQIPAEDGSFDAVLVATAWHWFDEPAASREIARVLRPGGRLAVVRNDRDTTVGWVASYGRLLHAGDPLRSGAPEFDPRPGDAFGPVERTEVPWSDEIAPADLRGLAASRSHLLTLPAEQREALLDEIDAFATTDPALAGRRRVALPYLARAVRTDRRAHG